LVDTIKLLPKKPAPGENFLKEKYIKEGLSSNEIATLVSSSRSGITKLLKINNISLQSVTRKNSGGHVFGYRKHGGKCIELKKEQNIIRLICLKRESGFSYQKISNYLNDQKVSTKTNIGNWYPKVVRSIFLKNKRTS